MRFVLKTLWGACGAAVLSVGLAAADHSLGEVAARYEAGASVEALQQIDALVVRALDEVDVRKDLEVLLIRMLQPDATAEARLFACQRLAVVGTEASLAALGELLRSPDTVGMACLALANHPADRAGAVLRQALVRLEGTARIQVVSALGTRRDTGAVRALSGLASGSDLPTAEAAALALGRIANGPARRALAGLRRSPAVGMEAALDEAWLMVGEALVREGDRGGARRVYLGLLGPAHANAVRAGALEALLTLEPARAEALILRILRREDPDLLPDVALRPVAIAGVGRLGSAASGAVMAAELARLEVHERVFLIAALADLGARAPRDAMAAQLEDSSAEVRLAVIRAFARLNDPADVSVLAAAMVRSGSVSERRAVESALVQLPGGVATDQMILRVLRNGPVAGRAGLINVLAMRGTREAVPEFLRAIESPETPVARAAWQGLGRLATPDDLPGLLDRYVQLGAGVVRDDAEATLAQVLGRVSDPEGRARMITVRVASAGSVEGRTAYVRLLPIAGDGSALAAAREALLDSRVEVRDAGVRALAAWPTSAATDSLFELWRGSDSEAHRALALRGLVRLAGESNTRPSAELVVHYGRLLAATTTDEERKLILGALGGCGRADALELALEQLDQVGVKAEAGQAVRRIADAIKGTDREAAEAALKRVSGGP
jgi:HEAT repeat protein